MMPHKKPIIPGGRPRSSSHDGILDIDEANGLCGALLVNRNDRNCTDGSGKRGVGRTHMTAHNSASNLNYSDENLDSDSKHSSGSSALSARKGLTLKSMRKAVSRVFVKESRLPDDKSNDANDLLKVWTPDLRHIGDKASSKSSDLPFSGTLSTARPLITNSHIGMPIAKWTRTPGTVGIYNHGNNCFMNAILQCLSNTDSFTEYFIRDFFKNDLKNGASGKKGVFRSSHGKVTEQLGHFLKCLWSGKYTREVSEGFKAVVAKFNSQYEGDDQHDAQEFLLWLLDRVHEDVSVFTKRKAKPHKITPVRTDKELASEASLANGESFILKLFQALHSSTLTCPTCGEYSNTFDPYLCLSLPLPQGYQRVVYVIVVFLESRDPRQVMMAFTLHQYDEVRELRELVASSARIPAKQLMFVQLEDDCFGTTYHDEQTLSDIPENEVVYAFEVHPENAARSSSSQEFDSPMSQILVMHVEITGEPANRFCSPAVLKVRRDITWKDLQVEIIKKMENSLSDDVFESQKLDSLFILRLYDGSDRKYYLPSDVDLPLYTQTVERAFSASQKPAGLPHIQIIAEWDSKTKSRFVIDDRERIETSASVKKAQSSPLSQGKVTLEECFRLYTKEEKLIGDDAWLCPHCKQEQQGTIKALSLWSLPDVLVLHLKRFKQSGPRRSKLNTLIDFPIDGLDMSAHVSRKNHSHLPKNDDYMYDLLAVSNHYGNMMGGHYTAYCRNPLDGKWREYDDAKVESLEGSVVTKEAYLLFYQRRSLSKSVNQRLFTGEHWIYSLHLSPSEKSSERITENSTTHLSSRLTQQVQNSRSRSASPSARRQNNKSRSTHPITASLTPQPVRRSLMPVDDKECSDDSSLGTSPLPKITNASRRSRSLPRQSSVSHSQIRREASVENSLEHNNRTHSNIPDSDKRDSSLDQVSALRQKLNSDIVRHASRRTVAADRSPPTAASTHNSHTKKDISTSKNTHPDLPLTDKAQEGIRTSPPSSTASGVLQKKQDTQNISQSSSTPHESPSLPHGDDAARKLASIMKQDIINRTQAAFTKSDTVDNSVKNDVRKHQTVNKINGIDSLADSATSQTSISNNKHRVRDFSSDTSHESQRNQLQHTNSVKTIEHTRAGHSVSSKDAVLYPDLKQGQQVDSGFKQKLNGEMHSSQVHKPLQKHVGGTNGLAASSHGRHTCRFVDDTGIMVSEQKSATLRGDVSRQNKSATISRTWRTSEAGRYEQNGIPHSNTDHNINYNNSYPTPSPLPTSLTHGGERTFLHAADLSSSQSSTSDYFTSSQRTNRLTHSSYNDESSLHHSSLHSDHNSFRSRTLSGHIPGSRTSRYKFHRPRGTFAAQAESAAKLLASVSNPCLRESSV